MNTSLTSHQTVKPLEFPYRGGVHLFSPEEIIRLEADSNYTYIYLLNHRPVIMAKVLADYEALLAPFGFLRTHRSHLINVNHVKSFHGDDIIMEDKSHAEISRRKKKEVYQQLTSLITAA